LTWEISGKIGLGNRLWILASERKWLWRDVEPSTHAPKRGRS